MYTNMAYQNLAGLTPEQSTAEPWITAIHYEDRQPILSAWQGFSSDQVWLSQEVRLLRPDGGVRWVRLHIAEPRDGGPANIHYVHTVEDVTARRVTLA